MKKKKKKKNCKKCYSKDCLARKTLFAHSHHSMPSNETSTEWKKTKKILEIKISVIDN